VGSSKVVSGSGLVGLVTILLIILAGVASAEFIDIDSEVPLEELEKGGFNEVAQQSYLDHVSYEARKEREDYTLVEFSRSKSSQKELGVSSKLSSKTATLYSELGRNERVPVIVLLKETRTIKAGGSKLKAAENDVIDSMGAEFNEKAHFFSIPGFAGDASKEALNELTANDEVIAVFYDEKINLPESIEIKGETTNNPKVIYAKPTISAQAAWALGCDGTGKSVAILDTGVDYEHADFGSCNQTEMESGNCQKIPKGYDFSDDDTNPMDYHGHGSHCAGIAASNSTNDSFKGMAPNATIFAAKVFPNSYDSVVITAIDWSIAEGADVISMSLGSDEQANDGQYALSLASDYAMSQGVVVSIAMGNEGPGTGTTGKPADSVWAISVGASDDNKTAVISDDTITPYSNRGPSFPGRLDPEFVAPGQSICATKLPGSGGTTCYDIYHKYLSGTSMATPAVAGAAAALLSCTSEFDSYGVRKQLMHTASDIGAHVFLQGAGEINLTQAAIQKIFGTINDDDRWEVEIVPGSYGITILSLENAYGTSSGLSISITDLTELEDDKTIGAGNVSFSESSITLGTGDTQEINVTIEVPSDALPAIYGAIIEVTGANNSLRIPVVLTVPLITSGAITGTLNNSYVESGGSIYEWGDWIFYKLKSPSGIAPILTLSWDNAYDVDLYVFDNAGNLVAVNGSNFTVNPEILTLPDYGVQEYWVGIHAYTVTSGCNYTLLVSYDSSLFIEPIFWTENFCTGELAKKEFIINNTGNEISSPELSVKRIVAQDSQSTSSTIPSGYCSIPWQLDNPENISFVDIALNFSGSNGYFCFGLEYYDGSDWTPPIDTSTAYNERSCHTLEYGEIVNLSFFSSVEYASEQYEKIGFFIGNAGPNNLSYDLTVIEYNATEWSLATISPELTSIPSGTSQVNVSINTTSFLEGDEYMGAFTLSNGSSTLVSVPINLYTNDSGSPFNLTWNSTINSTLYQMNPEICMSSNRTIFSCNLYWNGSVFENFTEGNQFCFEPWADVPGNYSLFVNCSYGLFNSNLTGWLNIPSDSPPVNLTLSESSGNFSFNWSGFGNNFTVYYSTNASELAGNDPSVFGGSSVNVTSGNWTDTLGGIEMFYRVANKGLLVGLSPTIMARYQIEIS